MSETHQTRADINITPLIDVLLVLLIIFMVISPTELARYETKVPNRSADAAPDPEVLVVSLAADLSLSLNSTAMTTDELRARLASELSTQTDRTVILRASKGLAFGRVSAVLDVIRGAGGSPIGLQVDFLE